ncbi:uncharacterized protein [Panulirus ornatus]|uniref:uncharacterized protein isoform X2 n=1 Tax=Panulirus ornatus TaxID=150431 RepID=UPI003A85B26D
MATDWIVEEKPEYLVSQSSHTCLTVLKGTGPTDAVLGMAKCTGDMRQRWVVHDGQWRWGANPSFCLVPDKRGGVTLAPSVTSSVAWTFDDAERLVVGTDALDVPWPKPRIRILMYPKHDGINQKWWLMSKQQADLKGILEGEKNPSSTNSEISKQGSEHGHQTYRDCHSQGKTMAADWIVEEKPEYLVSQSSHTCLTVLKGTGPADAVLGMAKCTGDMRQRWVVHDGQWRWGANPSFCLVPDKRGGVTLAPSVTSSVTWTLDDAERLVVGTDALDVPWPKPRIRILMYPKHDGINQKWWLMSKQQANLKGILEGEKNPSSTSSEISKQGSEHEHQTHRDCHSQGKTMAPDWIVEEKPEYLVSQSSHTCLTVLKGTGPADAVLGMAKCTGDMRQRWVVHDGQWRWGANPSFCLVPDKRGGVTLAPSVTSSVAWTFDDAERLVVGTDALDVPWPKPRIRILMYPKHDGINQKWWLMSKQQADLKGILEGEKNPSSTSSEISKQGSEHGHQTHSDCHSQGKVMATDWGVDGKLDFLVSQSSHTCLTVLRGTCPADAVLGLAKCTGNIRQQWLVHDGHWRWGANPSYCLVPNNEGSVSLASFATSQVVWTFDDADRMVVGSKALDVPWQKPRICVLMYPKHDYINQKWWTLSKLKTCMMGVHVSDKCLPLTIATLCKEEHERELCSDCHFQEAPDYLISQSTHTFVTVLSGTDPQDAVVGLAPYNGSTRQQWFFRDGQWQWGSDRSLCLTPDWKSHCLMLAPCSSASGAWTHDMQGLFSMGSYVMEVPAETPQTRILVHPKHGGKTQQWWTLSKLKAALGCKIYPFSACDTNVYKQEVARGIINKLSPLSGPLPHLRDVDHFPGTVASTTRRISANITLNVSNLDYPEYLRMTVPEDWQATDMYVVDGDVFQVILPETLSPERASQITVRVGAHCDNLTPTSDNVSGKDFKRMPVITEEFDVEPGVNNMRSQFGGNLIFMYDEGEKFVVDVEVRNVVKAPHYIMGHTDSIHWQQMKQLDSPYSILETERVVLVVPTEAARSITDPDELLQHYDGVMSMLEYLAGFDETDPPPQGKQWLVDDIQISAGSAHAGFPAMFNRQYYNLCSTKTPLSWVTWHELGHNYQQKDWWSYAYGSESTVNLFSLYIQEQLMGEDRLKKDNLYVKTAAAVDKGLIFQGADCWQKLVFLMEIKHAFPQQGWKMYRQLNRTTRKLSKEEADILAHSTQRQYDYVYRILSCMVGADLILHYRRWGLPISLEAQREVKGFGLQEAPANLSGQCQH